MAIATEFRNEIEFSDNSDDIRLLKVINYPVNADESKFETDYSLDEEKKTKKEKNEIIKSLMFNLAEDKTRKDKLVSSSSSSINLNEDQIVGKYSKLENNIFPQNISELDKKSTIKKVKIFKMMASIQIGLHYTIASAASKPQRDLLMNDFMLIESTTFAASGSNRTPAHSYSPFVFKTYAPTAFQYFRQLFDIPTQDYMLSFCKNPLNESSYAGSSGSLFYVTSDDKFIIKTIQHKECEFLQKLLPGYYLNLHQNPKTLLPKFFGLYCYKCEMKRVRLVAMNNLLPSDMKLYQKYDLKGSTYKRYATKKSKLENETPTYKDLDFINHYRDGLYLDAEIYNEVIKTIQRDCTVLESFKIMDYSLLLGIYNIEKDNASDNSDGDNKENDDKKHKFQNSNLGVKKINTKDKNSKTVNFIDKNMKQEENKSIGYYFGGIPAKTVKGEKLLIYIGIIDILQSYRLIKRIEHSWKSILHNADTISVHNPGFYSRRFQKFITERVFKKLPAVPKHKKRSYSKIKSFP